MQGTPGGVVHYGNILQPPWENHGLHEKNTIISKAPGECTIELLGSDQIHSHAMPLPLLSDFLL